MDNTNSEISSITGSIDDAEQAFNLSKNATMHRPDGVKSVQNIHLIWLDKNIDEENSADYRNIITQLRSGVNTLNTFSDANRCIDFLTDIDDEQVFLIISGTLYKKIVPLIHDITSLHTIYIYCENKTRYEQWAKEWPKVKGVFTEISPICAALNQAAQPCEQNAIPINFLNISGDTSCCSFVYTQIIEEVLSSTEFEQPHAEEFLQNCPDVFVDYHHTLDIIAHLKQTSIWWDAGESLVYPMCNRTLPIMNVEIIINMDFFIDDLHRQIEQLNGHHSSETFTVYRGQGMSKTDFEQMVGTKRGLMSFDNFLSTSKDHDAFARSDQGNPGLVGVIFVMTIEPSESTTPFASITEVGCFGNTDDEGLDENYRLFQVNLALTNNQDKDPRVLTDRIREETFPDTKGWYRIGESDKTLQLYEIILEQEINNREKTRLRDQLRLTQHNPHEYNEVIRFYEQLLTLRQKTLPLDCPNETISYNNIGAMHENLRKYSRAFSYFEKAFRISQQSSPIDHPDLATSYNNIDNF